jgi:hypothetical protein
MKQPIKPYSMDTKTKIMAIDCLTYRWGRIGIIVVLFGVILAFI